MQLSVKLQHAKGEKRKTISSVLPSNTIQGIFCIIDLMWNVSFSSEGPRLAICAT